MRGYFIAGNWKMHKTCAEAVALAQELVRELRGGPHTYMIAPSFTALDAVGKVLRGSNVLLGAQDVSSEEWGAHTGEVSVLQLEDLGVQIVIVGHSERRHGRGENDKLINQKVRRVLESGLRVILCVGERLQEYEAGCTNEVVGTQVRAGMADVCGSLMHNVTVAYEPVWAIGTGKTATPAQANAVHAHIRSVVREMYGAAIAEALCIQYGGSMKAENARALLAEEHIDGGLIGGASLEAASFVPIARSV